MKKKLLLGLLAAAAVSFTACQKNEVISEMPQDNAISFNTYLGRGAQTKGSIVEIDQLKAQGFGVFAYYTGQTTMSAYASDPGIPATPNFMNNVKVTHKDWNQAEDDNPNNNTWGYENIKYWPNTSGDKISFYAYGPYDNSENAITIDVAGKKPVLTYTVDNDISNHMDVLFAPAQEDQTKTDDPINFVFAHALSRIEFEVKTAADYTSNATINLSNVSLSGAIYPSGTLALGGSTVDWTEAAAVSKTFSITDTRAITSAPRTVETDAGTTDYIMIIPQNFTSNNLTLSVTYTVQYTDPSQTITNTVTKDDVAINFEQGKAYKIIIKVGMDAVDFSATVTAWNEDHDGFNTGTEVTI